MIVSLNPLLRAGCVVELRVPKARYGTASGYFNDPEKLLAAASELDGKAPGVYITLNPVIDALLARAANRVETRTQFATSDADISQREWLLVDVDPIRPSGISSTDAEHCAALERISAVRTWLTAKGWPEPVEADSGNGAHLLYSVALPNNDPSRALLKSVLEVLALQFNDDVVAMDTGVYNAGRIIKLYGTLACKGDATPERPHRRSCVLAMPWPIIPVRNDLLQALAALRPKEPKTEYRSNACPFDVRAWISQHNLTVTREKPWQNGTVFELSIARLIQNTPRVPQLSNSRPVQLVFNASTIRVRAGIGRHCATCLMECIATKMDHPAKNHRGML